VASVAERVGIRTFDGIVNGGVILHQKILVIGTMGALCSIRVIGAMAICAIDNAAAGAAVNIQDGGNAITVDGSVTVSGTATVTQAGTVTVDLAGNNDVTVTSGDITETNSGDIEIAVQLIDDMIYVDDTAVHATGTTKGAGIMATATPTDTVIDANDIGMVGMSVDRRLHIDAQIVGSDADINVEVTETEFDSNLTKLSGSAIAKNSGVLADGVQRITIATDDEVNNDIDAIMTAVQIIDDWDDTNYANVNMNIAWYRCYW